jgi:acetyltransferase
MTVRNFDALFSPRSVALIGASVKAGSVGCIVAQNLLQQGFKGPIWLINPKYTAIGGHPCFASIAALPASPDLAVIATPADTVPGLIKQLGEKGARAAVVITAGIRDDLKQAMLDASRPYTLRIQGPNCVGLMLPDLGLNASFATAPQAGDIAFLSQSGALITGIIDWASARNIGFSHVVSMGDMADVDFGDLLDHLAADARARAVLIYMESVTHAPKFMSAARRAARSKPVIVIKTGRSRAGAQAAHSHTGALAGADAAYEAAFRRAGLLRVRELDDLFSAAEMLSRHPKLTGERLTILTNGGGAGVMATDRLGELGGMLASLDDGTRAALGKVLPPTWSQGNPVDIIGDADAERYARSLEILLDAKDSDAVLVMNCPTALASSTDIAAAVAGCVERHRIAGRAPKTVLATWLGEVANQAARNVFAHGAIANFATPSQAVDGYMQLVRYRRAQNELTRTPPSRPEAFELDIAAANATIEAVTRTGRTLLSEVEGKSLFAAYGIPVVTTEVARDPSDVGRIAASIIAGEQRCVVKILSDDISHKSDVGGVRLGLDTPEDAQRAADDMHQRVRRLQPHARIQGFTVQAMIERPHAHELIVGMSVDQSFGPLLMFGAGGTAVEVLRDTAHALPPLDHLLAQDLMRQTRIWSLLKGYRDRPAANLDAIADGLVRISYLVCNHPSIREIDVNPLLADEQGVIALDARVVVADANASPRLPLAIRPYPSHWEGEADIAGIGLVRDRPIRPSDEHLYESFFANVTVEDRRLRFFGAGPDLSHGFLARLTQIDYAREMVFVAIQVDDGALLGVVRMVADPDYQRAEYAILVRSDLKGLGLGWRLMHRLIDYAKHEGLQELSGSVLAGNVTMLDMCRQLGFIIRSDPSDQSVRTVTLDLRGR